MSKICNNCFTNHKKNMNNHNHNHNHNNNSDDDNDALKINKCNENKKKWHQLIIYSKIIIII